jgi:hypothetical protein
VIATPLDVTGYESCGLCWQGNTSSGADGSITIYVSHPSEAVPGDTPVGLYRQRIPPA